MNSNTRLYDISTKRCVLRHEVVLESSRFCVAWHLCMGLRRQFVATEDASDFT